MPKPLNGTANIFRKLVKVWQSWFWIVFRSNARHVHIRPSFSAAASLFVILLETSSQTQILQAAHVTWQVCTLTGPDMTSPTASGRPQITIICEFFGHLKPRLIDKTANQFRQCWICRDSNASFCSCVNKYTFLLIDPENEVRVELPSSMSHRNDLFWQLTLCNKWVISTTYPTYCCCHGRNYKQRWRER